MTTLEHIRLQIAAWDVGLHQLKSAVKSKSTSRRAVLRKKRAMELLSRRRRDLRRLRKEEEDCFG